MARLFNGTSSDYIEFVDVPPADTLAAFTAMAIIRISADVTTERMVLTKGSAVAGDFPLSMYNTDASNQNRLTCYIRGATQDGYVVSANNTVPLNTWVVAISTWDGGVLPKLYACTLGAVMGSELTYALTQNLSGAHVNNDALPIRIGARADLDTNFAGVIAETAIWNRVLTAPELANLGLGYEPILIPSGLVFYSDIGGVNSPETNSAPGSGLEAGTVVGTTFNTHPPMIAPGVRVLPSRRPRAFAPGLTR